MKCGLDNLLVRSLDAVIKENLSKSTLQKIENRLIEKYGLTITQALDDFKKLDVVLREFFGPEADVLKKRILENVCILESEERDLDWMVIEDQSLTKVILESFGDEDKKKILTAVLDEPHIISEILDICRIPQTSGYRKINSLINDGLLTTKGFITTSDGKRVNKYISVFDNVRINIIKNKVIVKVKLGKDSLNDSTMIQLIRSL